MSPADTELIEKALQGDPQAVSELVGVYTSFIERIARRIVRNSEDVADITQEVLLKLFVSFSELERLDRFNGWVYRIAYRTSIDWIRALSRRPAMEYDSVDELSADDKPLDSVLVQKEELSQVVRAIDSLPTAYRQVLTLYYIDGHSSRQIALRLKIPVGTVRVNLHRGRAMLRRKISVLLAKR